LLHASNIKSLPESACVDAHDVAASAEVVVGWKICLYAVETAAGATA
jgi:hypothetical protein